MKKLILLSLCLSFFLMLYCQKKDQVFTVVFYNVENLFDIVDHPETNDEEFTPEAEKAWDMERYQKKLDDIAAVIRAVKKDELPEVVGLCEVENKKVLDDLIQTKDLKKGEYGIVHHESPDTRGIDCALLYRMQDFHVISSRAISVTFPFDSVETTRDILYVEGTSVENERLHFFVNHWSSRWGGEKESEPKRIFSAVALRKEVDALLNKDSEAKIIIMGDFNDEPTNRSVFEFLLANNKRKNSGDRELYNLMYDMHNLKGEGSYNYRGDWKMLDQIIVSKTIINNPSGLHCDFESGRILKEEFMMYLNESTQQHVPNRTYGGSEYFGGISDHLPVFITLIKD